MVQVGSGAPRLFRLADERRVGEVAGILGGADVPGVLAITLLIARPNVEAAEGHPRIGVGLAAPRATRL